MRFPPYSLSRGAPSATRPPLRQDPTLTVKRGVQEENFWILPRSAHGGVAPFERRQSHPFVDLCMRAKAVAVSSDPAGSIPTKHVLDTHKRNDKNKKRHKCCKKCCAVPPLCCERHPCPPAQTANDDGAMPCKNPIVFGKCWRIWAKSGHPPRV